MNEDMNDRLSRYLDRLEASVDTVIEFGSDQAPLVVNEFLAWEFWSSLVGCVICVSIITICCIGLYKIGSMLFDNNKISWDKKNKLELTSIIMFLVLLATCLLTPIPTLKLLKVSLAPRLVVLEKIADLAGKD